MQTMQEKLEHFRSTLEGAQLDRIRKDNFLTFEIHKPNYLCRVKVGRKYANVDVGSSGKYMVELATGSIYGIKAYGVIHRGHYYGTLDSIQDWDWSDYVAVRKQLKAA